MHYLPPSLSIAQTEIIYRTNILVRIITGVIQDADNNAYTRVTIVYVFLATASTAISLAMVLASFYASDLRILQYTRKQRIAMGHFINERKEMFHGVNGGVNRLVSKVCMCALGVYVLGSWAAYFWGVATGNN